MPGSQKLTPPSSARESPGNASPIATASAAAENRTLCRQPRRACRKVDCACPFIAVPLNPTNLSSRRNGGKSKPSDIGGYAKFDNLFRSVRFAFGCGGKGTVDAGLFARDV